MSGHKAIYGATVHAKGCERLLASTSMYPLNQGMLTPNVAERGTHFQWQWDNPSQTHSMKKRSQSIFK